MMYAHSPANTGLPYKKPSLPWSAIMLRRDGHPHTHTQTHTRAHTHRTHTPHTPATGRRATDPMPVQEYDAATHTHTSGGVMGATPRGHQHTAQLTLVRAVEADWRLRPVISQSVKCQEHTQDKAQTRVRGRQGGGRGALTWSQCCLRCSWPPQCTCHAGTPRCRTAGVYCTPTAEFRTRTRTLLWWRRVDRTDKRSLTGSNPRGQPRCCTHRRCNKGAQ